VACGVGCVRRGVPVGACGRRAAVLSTRYPLNHSAASNQTTVRCRQPTRQMPQPSRSVSAAQQPVLRWCAARWEPGKRQRTAQGAGSARRVVVKHRWCAARCSARVRNQTVNVRTNPRQRYYNQTTQPNQVAIRNGKCAQRHGTMYACNRTAANEHAHRRRC